MALSKLTLSVYPQEFPGIVIGEVEPTSYIDGEPGWQVDLQEWAAEFRALETPIAFMRVDVQWARVWVSPRYDTRPANFPHSSAWLLRSASRLA